MPRAGMGYSTLNNEEATEMRTVHKVCSMLRKHDEIADYRCKECPATVIIASGYKGKQGCRLLAEEMVNIVMHGNPWGRKYRNTRRSWPDKQPK